MVDPNTSEYVKFSLGETTEDGRLLVGDDENSVLVGRTLIADTFTVQASDAQENNISDMYLFDFDASEGDSVQFEGYSSVLLSADEDGYADGFATLVATRSDESTVDFNVYFVDSAPVDDEWFVTTTTA